MSSNIEGTAKSSTVQIPEKLLPIVVVGKTAGSARVNKQRFHRALVDLKKFTDYLRDKKYVLRTQGDDGQGFESFTETYLADEYFCKKQIWRKAVTRAGKPRIMSQKHIIQLTKDHHITIDEKLREVPHADNIESVLRERWECVERASPSSDQPVFITLSVNRLVFETLPSEADDALPEIQMDLVSSKSEDKSERFKYIVVSTDVDGTIPGCELSLSKIMMLLHEHRNELYSRIKHFGPQCVHVVRSQKIAFSDVFSACELQSVENHNAFRRMHTEIQICDGEDPTKEFVWAAT